MLHPIAGAAVEASPGLEFTWFVYGSSLDRGAFASWAAEHGHVPPDLSRGVPARLVGWRLAFDVASRAWGGAVATLAEAAGEFVEGLAVRMPASARGLVDHREGALAGLYAPFDVVLVPAHGGGAMRAVAYRAVPSRRLPVEAPPAPAYLSVLLRGARASGLSPEWIARLDALAAR